MTQAPERLLPETVRCFTLISSFVMPVTIIVVCPILARIPCTNVRRYFQREFSNSFYSV